MIRTDYISNYQVYDSNKSFQNYSTQTDSSDGNQDYLLYSLTTVKYKTQVCKNYTLMGFCNYGDKCQFAHGQYELNPLFISNLYKTKKCKNFWKKGYCLYGIRCQFIHSEHQQPFKRLNEHQNKKKMTIIQEDFKLQSRLLHILNDKIKSF